MKVLSTSIFFLVCVAAALAVSSQWGARQRSDSLLFRERVNVNGRSGQSVIRNEYFPPPGFRVRNITLIRANDNVRNGTGANASLTSGGPGSSYSNLRFNSQRNYGINFTVEYYGY